MADAAVIRIDPGELVTAEQKRATCEPSQTNLIVMTSRGLPAHVIIIGAVALAAMTLAHELTLLGSSMLYRHVAVMPIAETAVLMLAVGVFSAVHKMVRRQASDTREPDWALPAFETIRRLGIAPTVGLVLTIQILSLAVGESFEQHAAGLSLTGLTALFGTTLAAAPLIHLAVGIVAGVLLWVGAREICRHANAVVEFVRAIVYWLSRKRTLAPQRIVRSSAAVVSAPHLEPIAYFLANRPPPISVNIE